MLQAGARSMLLSVPLLIAILVRALRARSILLSVALLIGILVRALRARSILLYVARRISARLELSACSLHSKP